MLDEYTHLVRIERIGNWQVLLSSASGNAMVEIFYYLVKLDHLWCVPALVLLYIGLRRLAGEAGGSSGAVQK